MNSITKPAAAEKPVIESGKSIVRTLRWSLPFFATLLPIMLLSMYSFRVTSDSIEQSIESENLSAATNLSQILTQDVHRILRLSEAVASLDSTLEGISQRDEVAMTKRLQVMVLSYPQINHAFIIDGSGSLWTEFPPSPEAKGGPLSKRYNWVKTVNTHSIVSDAYLSPLVSRGLVLGIANPLFTKEGEYRGILVFEYDLTQVTGWIQNIRISKGGHLYLLDSTGLLVAHPTKLEDGGINRKYASVEEVRRTQRGESFTERYTDPLAGEEMIGTFMPLEMGRYMWVLVAQQPTKEAFAFLETVKWSIALTSGLLTFLTLGMVIALGRTSARNERLNRKLKDANRALNDFASIVSHQLKAPTASMGAVLECVFDGTYGPFPKELEEPLKSLKDVNDRNHTLIMDILNMSRLDRGVVSVALTPVSTADVMEDSVKHYREWAKNQNIALVINAPATPVMVMADKDKLIEAVGNSVSNALKHTKSRSITLSARTENGMGIIDVTDTGEGMPPEMVNKLFSKDQVFGTNTSAESSAGLGLYIAIGFMKLQKGDITVKSEEGKGTTFSYSVPLAPSV